MNAKCKCCDYISKCSRFCEYNSIMCLMHRSFPKTVDKTYEELEKENQELKLENQRHREVIDKLKKILSDEFLEIIDRDTLLDTLKEVGYESK